VRVVSGTSDVSQKSRGGASEMAVVMHLARLGREAGSASMVSRSATVDGCVFARDRKASRDRQCVERVLRRVVKPAEGGEEEGAEVPWSVRLGSQGSKPCARESLGDVSEPGGPVGGMSRAVVTGVCRPAKMTSCAGGSGSAEDCR
jgi:hypothetical protein